VEEEGNAHGSQRRCLNLQRGTRVEGGKMECSGSKRRSVAHDRVNRVEKGEWKRKRGEKEIKDDTKSITNTAPFRNI
jgi:hypothetical protein